MINITRLQNITYRLTSFSQYFNRILNYHDVKSFSYIYLASKYLNLINQKYPTLAHINIFIFNIISSKDLTIDKLSYSFIIKK